MRHITSREHPLPKKLLKLQHSARYRRDEGVALLDGTHLLQSCLASGWVPEQLIVSESGSQHPEIGQLLLHIQKHLSKVDCVMLSDTLFSQISAVKTPVGVLALVNIPRPAMLADTDQTPFWISLEGIQDPGNLGSILRSAAAAGVTDIFLSAGCADSWSPKTLRAGMGAHFSLRIHENADLVQIAHRFDGKIVATTLNQAGNLYQTDLRGAAMFIFGSEGGGVSQKLLEMAQQRVKIPMPGCAESLNVAAAAAICLFEKVRQEYSIADTDESSTGSK